MLCVQNGIARPECRIQPLRPLLSHTHGSRKARFHIATRQRPSPFVTRAQDQDVQTKQDEGTGREQGQDVVKTSSIPSWAWTAGGLLAWAAFVGYGFILSPNQTPSRDIYFVEKLLNVAPEDGFHINTVFSSIFFLLGLIPAIYTSLIIPAGRSKNKIPAWPFLIAMTVLGNYAFLPYAALWQPDASITAPPTKQDLEGWTRVGLRLTESTLFPLLLLLPVLWYVLQMVICGGEEWNAFFLYFKESRFVHDSTVDFISVVLLLPFWMSNDANVRQWPARDQLLPVLSCLPLIGPLVYLILRPKTKR